MAEEITISDLIAALEAASDLDREVIANILGVESFGAQQALTSTDQKQRINMRFLKDGAEVTTNSAGTTVGLTGGKGQFDIVNFTGGATAAIDSATNARQLNVSVGQGSGADCMFDFLVSECFATLTGFSEGQVFTSLSGCTFKGYSTVAGAAVQAAIDFATTTPAVVFVCSGVYEESVPIATGQAIQFTGAGREATYIGGLTGVSVGATFECAPGVTAVRLGLRSMTVESNDTTTGTASAGLRVPGDNSTVVCYDVHFIGAITNAAAAQYGADITEVSGDMPVFTNCTFSGNYGLYIHGSSPNAMITGCNFVDNTIAIRCGEDLVISGCHFRSCTTAISLIAASSDVNITGNHFVACTTGIASEGDYCSGILISSNTFNGLTTFVNFASLIGSSFNYGTVITNNRGSASTTLVALPAALERVQLEVNGNQNAGGSGTQAVYTGLRHPYMKFWDNSTDSDTGNQLEPIDGGHANLFTGNIWWLRQIPTPMAVGVTACVIRFGDTDVQVARQQQNLTPSIENFIEINSAGTLVVSTAWTPGTYHVLRVTCGISAGNATYTSHIDVAPDG